jgi:hypothetical protein
MATFLDIAGQEYISTIMVFLLVVVGVYAMLSSIKLFAAPPWVYALLATIMAFFVIISPTATSIARNAGPWFAVLMVLALFIMMGGKMVGGDGGETIAKVIFYVFIFFIIVFSIGPTAREGANIPGDNSTGDVDYDYSQTSHVIFHPKMLGLVLIFGVAVAAAALLVHTKV